MTVKSLGNAVSFELSNGETVELPPGYWITVDKGGALWRKCDVAIVPAYSEREARSHRGEALARYGGHLGGEGPAFFAIPTGPRRKIGRVKQVLYTRPDQGGKYHPFASGKPVILHGLASRRGWILELPDGCTVNALGFEWP